MTLKNKVSFPWATAGGLGAILLWSTTVALSRSLIEKLGPMNAGAAVCWVCGLCSVISLLISSRKRLNLKQLSGKYLAGCGAIFVAYMLALFPALGWAQGRQQVLEVGLINYLWPALTLLLSLVILKRKASWVIVPGTLLALAGIFLVVTQGTVISPESLFSNLRSNPAAYLFALAAAVLWALYSNFTKKWADGREDGAVAVFFPVAAVVFSAILGFVHEPRLWNTECMREVLCLGLATYFGYEWWDNAMRKGNEKLVVSASYLTPFLSTVISCFYLEVQPGISLWAGCTVLVAGSFLSWKSIKKEV